MHKSDIIGSVRSGYPIEGAAALGFRYAFFAVHRAWSEAASDLLWCEPFEGGVLCHYVIAKLVISRFPKVGDLQKPWVSVVNAIKTENKAWIPGAPDVPHGTCGVSASLHRFGLPTDWTIRRVTLIYISHNINALFWLFVMYSDTLLVDFNEIKRNVIYNRPILSSIPSHGIDWCHSGAVTSRTKRTFVLFGITSNTFHFPRMLYSIKCIMYVNSSVAYFFLLALGSHELAWMNFMHF